MQQYTLNLFGAEEADEYKCFPRNIQNYLCEDQIHSICKIVGRLKGFKDNSVHIDLVLYCIFSEENLSQLLERRFYNDL